MNFFKKLGALIWLLLLAATGVSFILVAAGVFPSDVCSDMVTAIQGSVYYQSALGVVGALFVIAGILTPIRVVKGLKKDRVIAFQNPDGEVSVSLSAIEDYVRKIVKGIPGIKDIRSRVDMNKKGINITSAVTMAADANIPEVTEHIQMLVRSNVQNMLGVEEKVNIKLRVNKIIRGSRSEEIPAAHPEAAPGAGPQVPFREME